MEKKPVIRRDMYGESGFQEHFERLGITLKCLNFRSRLAKANKIIAVLEDFSNKRGKRLRELTCLDIGCSIGVITGVLSKHFKKIVGIDTDKKALEMANAQFLKNNVEFIVGNGLNIPYPDESFDVVVCNHIYEHVPDVHKLISEIYRTLKSDGFCYFSAVNKYHLIEAHYKLPFLSWLPQNLADLYLKVTGKGKTYEIRSLSYWKIKEVLKKFQVTDYTINVLKNPKKYSLTDIINATSFITEIPVLFLKIIQPLIPTYIFVLSKNKRRL